MRSSYVLSRRADDDIKDIFLASLAAFGEIQTDKYMTELEHALALLASSPGIGSLFEHDRTGRHYRRHRHGSHAIYYRQRDAGIFVVRILHVRMLPERHLR